MITFKLTSIEAIAKFKNDFSKFMLKRLHEEDPSGVISESLKDYYYLTFYNDTDRDEIKEKSYIDEFEELPDELEQPIAPGEKFDKPEYNALAKTTANADGTTPSYKFNQWYRHLAPAGVDVDMCQHFEGGKGEDVTVVDIENGWNFEHEDNYFNISSLLGGTNTTKLSSQNHGTAVMGIIAGDDNAFGITGIAPNANFYGWGGHPIHSIRRVTDKLSRGDIILIECHVPGPATNYRPDDNHQYGYCPVEIYQSIYDSIRYAIEKGIVVIEAGGNGAQNLDHEMYEDKFNPEVRDSGAIIVGAADVDNYPCSFTNYGSRIDVFAQGRSVYTTGYGTLFKTDDSRNRYYTGQFCGTSSAAPIIAGVCAIVNGIRKARNEAPLAGLAMRDMILHGGSLQKHPFKPIGVMPNLDTIIKKLVRFPDYNDDGKVTFTDFVQFAKYYTSKDLRADLNGDGIVDYNDYKIFASKFNTKWSII